MSQKGVELRERVLRYIPRYIRYDFTRKLMALFFALLVWTIIMYKTSETATRTIQNVPIEFELNDGLVWRNQPKINVSLEVRGPAAQLENLSAKDFRIVKKVHRAEYDETRTVAVTPASVRFMPRSRFSLGHVTVLDVNPAGVELALDRIVSRDSVPLKPVTEGALPDDFRLQEVVFPPNQGTVSVTGPSLIVNALKEIQTVPIPLDMTIRDDTNYLASLRPQTGLQYSFDKVLVTIRIARTNAQKNLTAPIQILTGASDLSRRFSVDVTPSVVEITVEGNEDVLKTVGSDILHPFIDISKFDSSGSITVSVNCWSSNPDVKIRSIRPQSVTVSLREKTAEKSAEKTVEKER